MKVTITALLALLPITSSVTISAATTNAVTSTDTVKTNTAARPAQAKKATFIFELLENNGEKGCLVKYGVRTLTVKINNAPKTFYIERRSFAKEDAYVRVHSERLRQWKKRLDYLDGQAATSAAGPAPYVDAVMGERKQVNAEMSSYSAQLSDLNAYIQRLNDEKAKDRANEPYHHPKRCEGVYVGKDEATGVVEWAIARVF
ncbi:MAG: hypothetical protein AB9869_11470 [Verrucomicrobiia bacterium]